MRLFRVQASTLFGIVLVGSMGGTSVEATDIKLNILGLPPHGSPWNVYACPEKRRICKVEITIAPTGTGSECIYKVPDVIDAVAGITKVVRWEANSDDDDYEVGIQTIEFDVPGNDDVEDDPNHTNIPRVWHKRYKSPKRLSFLTYDVRGWYRKNGVTVVCSNKHGPAITNRG